MIQITDISPEKGLESADTPLDSGSDIITYHILMIAKGNAFYGVAVQPPKGKKTEVRQRLEEILVSFGYEPKIADIKDYLVFEGEHSPESMEAVRQYLASIEGQTPSIPVMRRGNYFQMLAYSWVEDIIPTQVFMGCPE
jgi:hypothetical protein